MIELQQKKSTLKDAQNIEAQAAVWLERRVSQDWNEEDQIVLDAWVAKSWAHRTAYLRLEAAWMRADRLGALRRPVPERKMNAAGRKFKSVLLGVSAASAIAIVIGVGAAWVFLRPSEKIYTTAVGAHETITLADGSQVELNTDTILRVLSRGKQRQAWLDKGEAYFRIRHDAVHPFIVMAAGHRLTDIGTEFLVREGAGRLEVALVKGSVRLDAADAWMQSYSALLMPGDVAIAKADSISVTKKSSRKLAGELSWRHGVLVFDHTTLADAAAEFNRYSREKLVVGDPATGRLMIYGTFPTDGVKAFIRVTQEVFGLHIENLGGESVISR